MLVFVGLGLHVEGISLQGIREARGADAVYAELYTSRIPGLDLKSLEKEIGKPVKVVDRKTLEENPVEILDASKGGKAVLLVPGDPMVATTHVDLRLRAAREGIETRLVHGGTIASAAAGVLGLQSYKFGPSATVPFPDNPSTRPYEVLAENIRRGLHTLLLLDIRAEEGRAMSANEAMRIMSDLEAKLTKGTFTEVTLIAVVARAGGEDMQLRAGRVKDMIKLDFGQPPHVLVVPGSLHFLEAEALKLFAGSSEELVG